jgi:isopentenyldiphosphate isomerase
MTEILDIFDDNMRPIGTMPRDEAHRVGAWHKTFHCWIVRQEGASRYVLFQRRSEEKKAHPNKLDVTAAGHLEAGESPDDGIREVTEELGATVQAEALKFLGIRVAASISGEGINREFNYVYLLHRDEPISEYRLQADEVSSLVQIELLDGLNLCARRAQSARGTGIGLSPYRGVEAIEIDVTLDDIIPRRDNYYMKMFIMAQRYFEGNPDICI